jgi:DNA-binding NtrC family response regulator
MYIPRARVDPATLPPSTYIYGAGPDDGAHVTGVVVVFSGGAPSARVLRCAPGPLELGRGDGSAGKIDDGRISRRHARIAFEGGRCVVTDLGSQNGTFVDGERSTARVPTPVQRVIRVGDSLLVPCADVRPFERAGVRRDDGFVRGPAMQAVLEQATSAARSNTMLHVCGENGTGKEGVAQAFHRAGTRAAGTLVAVNCATIPQGIAERLLFGVKRGAFTGADADAAGFVQEADGGTLFLDEIAELDLLVQAKLLRVLENKEVLPVGATKSRKIDFAFCSATNKDLRALVTTRMLREDLFFRIGLPAVTLPALRNRPEEIPALIAQELGKLSPAPRAHVSFVEQCLLRPWPGNVRELLAEVRIAAQAALAHGNRVEARHLRATAGSVFGPAMPDARPAAPREQTAPLSDGPRKPAPQVDAEWLKRLNDALRANAGNIAATARSLGLHRTQLRRIIKTHGIVVNPVSNDDHDDDNNDDNNDD